MGINRHSKPPLNGYIVDETKQKFLELPKVPLYPLFVRRQHLNVSWVYRLDHLLLDPFRALISRSSRRGRGRSEGIRD